jgi:hypothetical protein
VVKTDGKIVSFTTLSGKNFEGKMFTLAPQHLPKTYSGWCGYAIRTTLPVIWNHHRNPLMI